VESSLSFTLGADIEDLTLIGEAAIEGTGNDLGNILTGNGAGNVLQGLAGDDRLNGGYGDDTYIFAPGFGRDIASDDGGENDAVRVNGNLALSDITLVRQGDDVVLGWKGGSDQLVLKDWFSPARRIESIRFGDGTVVDSPVIERAVNNRAPAAADDATLVREDDVPVATGNVMANDSDPDAGDSLSVTNPGVYVGSYGTLILAADGAFTYALDNANAVIQALPESQRLAETFGYDVRDADPINPLSGNALLTVTIEGSNDAPAVSNDTAEVWEDGVPTADGNVLANDSDIDVGTTITLAASGEFPGIYGTLSLAQDGHYRYALDNADGSVQSLRGGQTVTEVFAYTATDGLTGTPGSLAITVTGTNDAPTANDDSAAVAEDDPAAATGNVLANDGDIDHDTVLRVKDPGNRAGLYGSLVVNTDGSYAYSLDNASRAVQSLAAGQAVTERFSYTVADDDAANPLTAAAAVTLAVLGANDAPTLENSLADQVGREDQGFSLAMPIDMFADIDQGDHLTLTVQSADGTPLPAWLGFDAATGILSGTPGAGSNGIYQIKVMATDTGGLAASDIFALTVAAAVVPWGQTIVGTKRADVLNGTDYDDRIKGKDGNDQMFGKGGGDTLDGGDGADTLIGGQGNDVYYVDDSRVSKKESQGLGNGSDTVVELAQEGYDLVYAKVSFTLPDHVEELRLLGSSDLAGNGNGTDNVLLGQKGANNLKGAAGNDSLHGADDDDTLDGGKGDDLLQGGKGNDRLSDGDGRSLFDGGAGNDKLTHGGSGALLVGGRGDDILSSGSGRNVILFNRGDGSGHAEVQRRPKRYAVAGRRHPLRRSRFPQVEQRPGDRSGTGRPHSVRRLVREGRRERRIEPPSCR
jgi:VCBS repeat-containing protein